MLEDLNRRQGLVEEREYDLLRSHADALWMRAILAVAYAFGFREVELLAVKRHDVACVE